MPIRCLLLGLGKMGSAYLKVLNALNLDSVTVWAPSLRSLQLASNYNCLLTTDSLDEVVSSYQPTHAIIATPILTLAPLASQLINLGIHNILVEKPVSLDLNEIRSLRKLALSNSVGIYVAYNRRFYESVSSALDLIQHSGESISSTHFSFNDYFIDSSGPLEQTDLVRKRWILANSLHVIDTATFPIGLPDPTRSNYIFSSSLPWHPSGGIFCGSGHTIHNVPFSYHSNWMGPGRWSVEWVTPSARYLFSPMEHLAVQKSGSLSFDSVAPTTDYDSIYKPGVFLQTRSFLFGDNHSSLVSLDYAFDLLQTGMLIGNYT